MGGSPPDWDARLREVGLRSTVARRSVLQALSEARHATVEELAAAVADRHPEVNLSTIYRTLEVLTDAGLVTHAHLHHGSPTYHAVEDEPHVHLVCSSCGEVVQQPAGVARELGEHLLAAVGFRLDVSHLAVHGRCADCAGADTEPVGPGSHSGPAVLQQP